MVNHLPMDIAMLGFRRWTNPIILHNITIIYYLFLDKCDNSDNSFNSDYPEKRWATLLLKTSRYLAQNITFSQQKQHRFSATDPPWYRRYPDRCRSPGRPAHLSSGRKPWNPSKNLPLELPVKQNLCSSKSTSISSSEIWISFDFFGFPEFPSWKSNLHVHQARNPGAS